MMPHDDKAQDMDMIAGVLQKIVDEMHGYESDRIMPMDKKPKMVEAEIKTVHPMDEEMESEGSSELDPSVLKELMGKAEEAGEDGSLPEDQEAEFPSEIQKLIAEKRKNKLA